LPPLLTHVHLLPSLIPPGSLVGQTAIVIDVLRATTAIVRALAAGCREVRPCLEIDEAVTLASTFPPGQALLAGERTGLPIDGFDLGNSPGDYTEERVAGRTLVMTTTNGTRAIRASLPASSLFVSSFDNLSATAAAALAAPAKSIHLVASGTDGRISFEDALLAGAMLARLGLLPANDEALLVAGLWATADRQLQGGTTLEALLLHGRGGYRVREIGLAPDVAAAARLDTLPTVVELLRQPDRLVARPTI
jgi:2-phosphosulfolactate phosphatase